MAQPNKRRKYFDRPSGGGSMDGNPAGAEAALARATARNRKPSVSSAQLQSGLPGGPTTAKASPSGLTPPIPPVPKIAVPEVTAQEKLEEASRPPLLQVDNGRVMKALASDPDARAGRKLAGTVRYDPLQPPASLLDGEVLRRNVGADVEVFVDGRWLEGIEWAIGSPGVETGANKWKSTGSSGIIVETPGSGASGRTVKGKAKGDKTTVPDRPSWTFWDLAGIAQRQAWGTDVYTDDSDVLAMCVHSGWLRIKGAETTTWPTTRPPITSRTTSPESGDGGEPETGDTKRVGEEVDMKDAVSDPVSSKTVLPARRRGPRETCTLKVSLKVAPKLVRYQGSLRGGLASRSWGNGHDGVSLIVDRVDVVSVRSRLSLTEDVLLSADEQLHCSNDPRRWVYKTASSVCGRLWPRSGTKRARRRAGATRRPGAGSRAGSGRSSPRPLLRDSRLRGKLLCPSFERGAFAKAASSSPWH